MEGDEDDVVVEEQAGEVVRRRGFRAAVASSGSRPRSGERRGADAGSRRWGARRLGWGAGVARWGGSGLVPDPDRIGKGRGEAWGEG